MPMAIDRCAVELVHLFISYGASTNFLLTRPVMHSVYTDNMLGLQIAIKHLANETKSLRMKEYNGGLVFAASMGDRLMVDELLAAGASIDFDNG